MSQNKSSGLGLRYSPPGHPDLPSWPQLWLYLQAEDSPSWIFPFCVIQSQDSRGGPLTTLARKEEWVPIDTSFSNLFFLSDIPSWFSLGTSLF